MPQIVQKNREENLELRQNIADFVQAYYEGKDDDDREYASWKEFKRESSNLDLQPRERVNEILNKFTQMKAKSSGMLRPGQVLLINYRKGDSIKSYLAIVVGTKRGAYGTFVAKTTKNKLVSCFSVADVSPYILASIMDAIYDEYKPQKLAYDKLVDEKENEGFRKETEIDQVGLQAAMSSATFRTFILQKNMTTIYEIQLDG